LVNQIASVFILTMILFGTLAWKVPNASNSQYALLGVMSFIISIITVVFWELLKKEMEGSRSILWKIIRSVVAVISAVVAFGFLFLMILADISEGISYDFFLKIVFAIIFLIIMNKKTSYDSPKSSKFSMICLQCSLEYPDRAKFCLNR